MGRISMDSDLDNYPGTKECMFCGEKLKRGGFWVGHQHVGCCKECAPWLIALFMDTMCDYEEFDLSRPMDTYEKMKKYCKGQIDKKNGILINNLKRKAER